MIRKLGLLLFSAAMLAAAHPSLATVYHVTVQNFSFTPRDLNVLVGDTVIWTNTGGFHNVHHTGTPSLFGNSLGSGWTYQFVFNLPAARYDYVCQQHAPGMAGSVTVAATSGIEEPANPVANEFTLQQNYPNPFNSRTTIEFSVPFETNATIRVLNVLGQQVGQIFAGRIGAGQHRVDFNASGLSTGIYYYQLEAAGVPAQIRKMVYLK
jgi:plastocyanin